MLVEFSITPIGKEASLSADVAQVVDLVDKSGLNYRLTPMSTIVEGEWDEIMELIKRCHLLVRGRAPRVATWIHIDDRPGHRQMITHKVAAVEKQLGRKLRTADAPL